MDAFAQMTADVFADPVLMTDAVYTPDGGSAVVTRALARTVDDVIEVLGPGRVLREGRIFEVPLSDTLAPQNGDALVVEGTAYTVRDVFVGPHRLWALLQVTR